MVAEGGGRRDELYTVSMDIPGMVVISVLVSYGGCTSLPLGTHPSPLHQPDCPSTAMETAPYDKASHCHHVCQSGDETSSGWV